MSVDYCDIDVASFRSERRESRDYGIAFMPSMEYLDSDDSPWYLALLMEQRADGTFPLSPDLLRIARITPDEAEALMRKSGLDEATFATALVIAVLHKHARDERETWDAAARKAADWLDARRARVEGEHPVDWLLNLI